MCGRSESGRARNRRQLAEPPRRARNRNYRKAYRDRVAEDPAKNAAYLARKAAAMFYNFHRFGPEGRRFATPREFADWHPFHVRHYKRLLDAGYPDGIPSGKRTAHLREREPELEREIKRLRKIATLQAMLDESDDD